MAYRTGFPNYLRRVSYTDTVVTTGVNHQQIDHELLLETDAALSLSSHPEFRQYHTMDLSKSWTGLRLLLPAFLHHNIDTQRTFYDKSELEATRMN